MSPIQTSMLLEDHCATDACDINVSMNARRVFFQGRAKSEPRPEGPRRGEVLGKGVANPSHQLGVPSANRFTYNFHL